MTPVEEIKARLDIVDVIGEYLQLKPAGTGSFKACCPFHQEKTPSFHINRGRQSWHCFGSCSEGGDLIAFVQKIEGMEFSEAMELLAQKAGITLPKFDTKNAGKKKRLQEVNDLLSRWMRSVLLTDPGAAGARSYIEKRGIDDLTADDWRIGWAPENWDAHQRKLFDQGVTAEELIDVGFAAKKDYGQGIYFRFRGRVLFPIRDVHGHVVGFTGRILSGEDGAKYINTPETELYKKSAVLYGLDKAKAGIRQEDLAIIVEGNMDALTAHQFGVGNVVASSGTALTREQLTLLKRFSKNLAIAFDMDGAGTAATLRGLDLAREMDFSIRVIRYDQDVAKDPDELIRKDLNAWHDAVIRALPIMDWVYAEAFRQYSDATPEGKKQIAQYVLNECQHISHPVERDGWIARLAEDLGVSAEALRDAMRQRGSKGTGSGSRVLRKAEGPSTKPEEAVPNQRTPEQQTRLDLEHRWLGLAIKDERLFRPISIQWLGPGHSDLYRMLKKRYDARSDSSDPPEPFSCLSLEDESLRQRVDFLVLFTDREFPSLSPSDLSREWERTTERLCACFMQQRGAELQREMLAAERAKDDPRYAELLAEFQSLYRSSDS